MALSDIEPTGSSYGGTTLSARDAAYIRSWMPLAEIVSRFYFRVRLYGLDTVPADDPVIFVGNHSGGLATPDTAMAVHGFWSYWGPDRPVYALVHPDIFRLPSMARHIARVGGLAATPRMAHKVLEAKASMLIYPGAGDEAYRPYSERNRVDLGGHSAYIRLALRYRAPIVPVVTLGGHDTLIVIDDGRARAQALGLDRVGIERLPLTYAWPVGLALGAYYSVPFPARLDIAFGPPIRFDGFTAEMSRDSDVVAWCHNHVEQRMQSRLDALLALRLGDRDAVDRQPA